MSEELIERLIKSQLELTEKLGQMMELVRLEMQSLAMQNMHRELQSAQNMSILSAIQYRGDR